MAIALDRNQMRLFGLDLSSLAAFARMGWEDLLQWKIFRWLNPEYPVRVIHADGSESVRLGTSVQPADARQAIRHVAVELREDEVLRRSLLLPRLSREELRQAAEIDVGSASPFPESELVWAHATRPADGERVRVDIALTTRKIIEREIASKARQIGAIAPEVWVGGAEPLVVSGYGESQRVRRARRERNVRLLLAALIVIQLAALAVTPTLLERQLAVDALTREAALKQEVKSQIDKRAELARLSEQVRLLAATRGEQRDLVWVLNEVTRLLPDDASLSRLEIAGNTVRLTGLSENAAQLIETLGANPAFRDVRAPAGIARARGAKESFGLEFSLAPAAGK